MPSASLITTSRAALDNNMTSIVRDSYQANGLIRNQQQQQQQFMQANSTSSLLRKGSPQFLYRQQQQQQHPSTCNMQFPPAPPPMAPMISQAATQVPKTDLSSASSYGSLLVAQQQQQTKSSNNMMSTSMAPPHQHNQMNGNNNNNNHLSMPNQNYSDLPTQQMNQQQQQLYQQYYHLQQANNNSIGATNQQQKQMNQNGQQQYQMLHQQHNHQQQTQLQHQQQQQQPQANQQLNQQPPSQQVPMTTIMIPASAAAQIQSASFQIQQATMQAMNNNSGQPQILVFMIPYMISQQPPTVPPTPDHSSLNSTLIKQSHLNSSFRLQSQKLTTQTNNQQQSHLPMHQQQQQQIQPIVVPPQQPTTNNVRALSSLSNNNNNNNNTNANTTSNTLGSSKLEDEKFFVKANFYYQPTRNKEELAFQKGEILQILDTDSKGDYGQQSWLATKVDQTGKDFKKGLIPDRKSAEKIALDQRSHELSDSNSQQEAAQGTNSVLSASVGRVNFLKRRAAQRSKSLCKDNWDNVVFDIGSMKFPPYERVIYRHPGFCRPVVIFGSLADFAREKLLRDYPEKYSYPSGFNQSPEHPKVIRLKGILEVIDLGKHALLDITPSAVEKLNYVNLAPIVIFMKTESKSIIKEFRARAAQSLDMETRDDDTLRQDGKSSRKLLEQSIKLEKTWSHVFTVILDLSMMGSEQWYRKLRETIEDQQSANVWMSDRKTDKKVSVASASNMNEMLFSVPTIQSTSSMDNGSLLSERFNQSMNLTSKSTLDLVPESAYGNRSQLRIAHAHSMAQELARASSEPKLNGLLSDHEDDDDDDDDDIIKKQFPPGEYENSSSISSSNGATSYGHGSMTGSNLSYHGNYGQLHVTQQQQQPQQLQHQQQLIQSNSAQSGSQMIATQYHQPQYHQMCQTATQQPSLTNHDHQASSSISRSNGSNIYSRNPYVMSNKTNHNNGIGNKDGIIDDNYHHLPSVLSNGNSDYHNTQNMMPSTNMTQGVVYGDLNQNIYH